MTREVRVATPGQSIRDVAKNMGENQVRRLPVVNREKRPVGIVALGDVSRESSARAARR